MDANRWTGGQPSISADRHHQVGQVWGDLRLPHSGPHVCLVNALTRRHPCSPTRNKNQSTSSATRSDRKCWDQSNACKDATRLYWFICFLILTKRARAWRLTRRVTVSVDLAFISISNLTYPSLELDLGPRAHMHEGTRIGPLDGLETGYLSPCKSLL